jgi:hypothetical protein
MNSDESLGSSRFVAIKLSLDWCVFAGSLPVILVSPQKHILACKRHWPFNKVRFQTCKALLVDFFRQGAQIGKDFRPVGTTICQGASR